METITSVAEPVKNIPPDFWYAISMILVGILIWIIQKYFASLNTTIKEISESIKDLTKIITRHDERIDQHDERLGNLENKNGPKRRQ